MPEGLQTADGAPVSEVPAAGPGDDAKAFAAAMAAPEPTDPMAPAPPKPAPKDPDAPYGRTQDGTPKKGPGGRPPKHAKPRVDTGPAAAAGEPARDYTAELSDFTHGMWFLLAMLPPTQAQAALFKANRPRLVKGFNLAAQQNATVRAGVELVTGSGGWIFALGMAVAPFAVQSAALWSGKMPPELVEQLAAATQRDMEQLAAAEAEEFARMTGIADLATAA